MNIPGILAFLVIAIMCLAFYLYGKFSEIEGGTEEEQEKREREMIGCE